MAYPEIKHPTLIVNKEICLQNIERMAQKAAANNLRLRPHFKTHQSAQIGEWFKEFNIDAITVSSVSMAIYFAENGWKNITIAFPVNIREIDLIHKLSKKIELNVLVENGEGAEALVKTMNSPIGVYLKIDTGYNRTGINSSKTRAIDEILSVLSENKSLQFKGFLTHTGHTYDSHSFAEINFRFHDALIKLNSLKDYYSKFYPGIEISFGDTPSCSVCSDFSGADEIRPGNFIFYDLMMYNLGVCKIEDIAVRLVCPVVARHFERNEIVIYGGAVHLSKDYLVNLKGKKVFGRILIQINGETVLLNEDNYVSKISQEHGILKITTDNFQHIAIGSLVEILPVHSCLTANLARNYFTTEGEKITTFNT